MADAARMVEAVGADIVDVNFGCPVKKVTKTGAGAHLLEDPDRACAIIAAIADAVDIPVIGEAAPRRAATARGRRSSSGRGSSTPARRRSRSIRARPSRCTRAPRTTR